MEKSKITRWLSSEPRIDKNDQSEINDYFDVRIFFLFKNYFQLNTLDMLKGEIKSSIRKQMKPAYIESYFLQVDTRKKVW